MKGDARNLPAITLKFNVMIILCTRLEQVWGHYARINQKYTVDESLKVQ